MRCIFHSTTPTVELRQLVRSYKLWKVFFHSCHVDSIGHDWILVTRFNKIYNKYFFEIAVTVIYFNGHHTIWTVKSCLGLSFVLETSHLNTTWPYGWNTHRYVQDSQNSTASKYILRKWGQIGCWVSEFPLRAMVSRFPCLKIHLFDQNFWLVVVALY